MKNKIFEKILLVLVLTVLLFPTSIFIIPPKQTQAVIPSVVTDPAHTKATIAGWTKNATNSAWNQRDTIYKWALKTAGKILKKTLLDRLVDATVAWINRGGEGAIIENWDQFFDKAGKDAAGIFAQSIGAGFLCSPFNVHVQLALLPVQTFSTVTCDLDQIVGNVDAFVNDFRNGSWIAYQGSWLPRNNFYGATLIALNDSALASGRAQAAAQSKAVAGRGFLSFEKEEYVLDPNGPYIDKNGTPFGPPLDPARYTGPRYSKRPVVVTPGSFVGDAVTQTVIATPINALIGADDTAAYIVAIVNAGVNKLTTLGVEGLKGVFKKKTSDFTTTTNRNPCSGLTGEAFRACLGYNAIQTTTFQNDRYIILSQVNDTLKPRQDAAFTLNQLVSKQSQLVDALRSLASCRPADTGVIADLNQEQQTLDDLQDKLDSNQTFLAPLEQSADALNSNSSNNDWQTLTVQSENSLPLLDPTAAQDLLTSVQAEATEINTNVDAKLPTVQNQLTSCPKTAAQ